MVRRILIAIVVLGCAAPVLARQRVDGYCEQGGQRVLVAGVFSSTYVQQSYVAGGIGCTVTIYVAGTLTVATIYADDLGTPKINPFSASNTGYYFFYADTGRYDVRLSGGGIASPFTRGDQSTGAIANTYAYANLPAPGVSGALAYTNAGPRGLWVDTTSVWASVNGGLSDVRQYGATGNGSTDDTVALQAALTAACSTSPIGGVFVPAGTYKFTSTLTGCGGLTIKGVTWGSVLQASGNINGLQISGTQASPVSQITLIDLVFEKIAGALTSGVAVLTTWANDVVVERVIVRNNGGVWGTGFACSDCNRYRLIDGQVTQSGSNSVVVNRALSDVGTGNQPLVTIRQSGLTVDYVSGTLYNGTDHSITGSTLVATDAMNNCTPPSYGSCNFIYWPGSGSSLSVTTSIATATTAGNIVLGTLTTANSNAMAYRQWSGTFNQIVRGYYLNNYQGIDINAQQDYAVQGVISNGSSSTYGAGIVVEGASVRGTLIGNWCQNNTYYGIDFEPVNADLDAIVLANIVTGNGSGSLGGASGNGIAVQTAGGEIIGNVVAYNQSGGMSLSNGTAAVLLGNTFRQNVNGLGLSTAFLDSVVGNKFIKNTAGIIWAGTPSLNNLFANTYTTNTTNWNGPGATANGNGGFDMSPQNMRGTVTFTGGGGTTSVVSTLAPMPDANYRAVCSSSGQTGTPAAGSTRCFITGKATTGFTINLEVDPGGGNTMIVDWFVMR